MRDWRLLIEQRLGKLKLPDAQRDEVVAELAAHLEDLQEDEKGHGIREPEAIVEEMYETTDWTRLARNVQKTKREEHFMNNRSRTFWLPALATFAAMQISWAILARTSFFEGISLIGMHPALVSLAALPFFGALGAWLSRRSGGGKFARMAVGIFPSIAMFCLMAVIFPLSLIVDHSHVSAHWVRICFSILGTVVVSGLALLVGTLPFLSNSEGQNLLHQEKC